MFRRPNLADASNIDATSSLHYHVSPTASMVRRTALSQAPTFLAFATPDRWPCAISTLLGVLQQSCQLKCMGLGLCKFLHFFYLILHPGGCLGLVPAPLTNVRLIVAFILSVAKTFVGYLSLCPPSHIIAQPKLPTALRGRCFRLAWVSCLAGPLCLTRYSYFSFPIFPVSDSCELVCYVIYIYHQLIFFSLRSCFCYRASPILSFQGVDCGRHLPIRTSHFLKFYFIRFRTTSFLFIESWLYLSAYSSYCQ